jgi:hypothetical protein
MTAEARKAATADEAVTSDPTSQPNGSKGQQTVRVEHVTVNAGGQAIVGNVQGGGGCFTEIGETSPRRAYPCTRARGAEPIRGGPGIRVATER